MVWKVTPDPVVRKLAFEGVIDTPIKQRVVEPKAVEPKAVKLKVDDHWAAEARAVEPKVVESKVDDAKENEEIRAAAAAFCREVGILCVKLGRECATAATRQGQPSAAAAAVTASQKAAFSDDAAEAVTVSQSSKFTRLRDDAAEEVFIRSGAMDSASSLPPLPQWLNGSCVPAALRKLMPCSSVSS